MKTGMDYEIPWRPAYELNAAAGWVLGGFAAYKIYEINPMATEVPFYITLGVCGTFAVIRFKKGMSVYLRRKHLTRGSVEIMPLKELQKEVAKLNKVSLGKKMLRKKKNPKIWVGTGFLWTAEVANRAYDLMDRGIESISGDEATAHGAQWLHGVGLGEEPVGWPAHMTKGHTIVVGTTGAGKTRLFDLLISQAIARGDAVIIIDPKGDKELAANAKRACEAFGDPDKFVYFHPAFPEKSTRIDPMQNWNRPTELASRLAALIPSETGSDPFTAFGWKAINDIVMGLIMINKRPNLQSIRQYIEGGIEGLVVKALRAYFEKEVKNWEGLVAPFVKNARGVESVGYTAFFKSHLETAQDTYNLSGLISGFEHNREHFQKMVASLIPILSMLTAEPLNDLLSPRVDIDDERGLTDFSKIINNGQCAYIGLDSLADSTVGSALGSILLADLTAVAGDRYNYGVDNRPIHVFVDEAAEVINKPVIQLLNKGRGADFNLTVATQTFADFVVRLGDEAQARQVLGNANNKFILRVQDGETQKYLAESFMTIMAKSVETQLRDGKSSDDVNSVNSMVGDTLTKTERELIHPSMFGLLPDLHMFAVFSNGQVYKCKIPVLVEK